MELVDKTKYILDKNYTWWSTPGAPAYVFPWMGYDRDNILEENPHSNLLININKYIITVDSQDDSLCKSTWGKAVNETYIKSWHRRWLKGCGGYPDKIFMLQQLRPYVLFLAPVSVAEKIFTALDNSEEYFFGMSRAEYDENKETLKTNKIWKARVEKGKNSIPVTINIIRNECKTCPDEYLVKNIETYSVAEWSEKCFEVYTAFDDYPTLNYLTDSQEKSYHRFSLEKTLHRRSKRLLKNTNFRGCIIIGVHFCGKAMLENLYKILIS